MGSFIAAVTVLISILILGALAPIALTRPRGDRASASEAKSERA